ncbi:hypothetical protein SCLCIDRAFT_1215075 [Scleroderma citrinum Foug A]|uniref:Uncharacterized protein n=1 Tax=Scleroderma citrinum Foug A TaxID=1036808 RepID=A0A0C3DPD8_9AGAM|nr:hypothetical protein SCLCIDRAFT_1215075 [Scleroderma citrinum Foug A]
MGQREARIIHGTSRSARRYRYSLSRVISEVCGIPRILSGEQRSQGVISSRPVPLPVFASHPPLPVCLLQFFSFGRLSSLAPLFGIYSLVSVTLQVSVLYISSPFLVCSAPSRLVLYTPAEDLCGYTRPMGGDEWTHGSQGTRRQ